MRKIIIFLGMLGFAAVVGAAESGKPAPDFTATDINGKTVKLSDYKGRIVVLESHNLDCPFCANHFKTGSMQELQKEAAAKGVVWLLVNSVNPNNPSHRSADAARAEIAAQKMSVTAWIDDSSGAVGHLYDMKTTPHMFVIDQAGVLAYEGAIDDQATPDHDPRKAKNYARLAIDEVLAGKKVSITDTKPYGCSVKY